MDDEVHIASFIVRLRPDAEPALESFAHAWPGLEISARADGRCILLHECAGTRELLDCMDAALAINGVISVNLVYHHSACRDALEETLAPLD
ncbi:MAG TPA: chaperone NapD [Rhodanobacteraceae bacterium]|jgi:nitrate reductase NapD|nr:chaperone NapD [Rhodanobacteraceae bacterium]